jgi:hypothetical protein
MTFNMTDITNTAFGIVSPMAASVWDNIMSFLPLLDQLNFKVVALGALGSGIALSTSVSLYTNIQRLYEEKAHLQGINDMYRVSNAIHQETLLQERERLKDELESLTSRSFTTPSFPTVIDTRSNSSTIVRQVSDEDEVTDDDGQVYTIHSSVAEWGSGSDSDSPTELLDTEPFQGRLEL